ncbi:solanesyl diphosphate synthase 3, chloroplastic/mitochondrial-like isoform X2 [Tasmannia lanceolata]|uniref:solanesyl diphosphate synthase 3, chloroplastic/mitochondrial-like isoform X2 n=1 Tax=Tasmannia lanceolata TaxID=3420 RepID=UPI0040646416
MSLRCALRRFSCKSRFQGHARFFSTGSYSSFSNRKPLEICSRFPIGLKVMDCRETYCWGSHAFHDVRYQIHHDNSSIAEEPLDPFSLVADELLILANRLRSMVVAEVPKLASAAEYFFKLGVEGKRFRPTVLLLMASALNMPIPKSAADSVFESVSKDLRTRQQCIAEITEMIHVASLLHDDVLDDADTRRGIGSLNFVMGNKLAVLAGDFLLSRACVALASLKNTEVVTLLATVVEHLVTGETMQMTTTPEQRYSMEYYLQKTYYKTASLISNSCKAIALLAGQTAEVSMLAFDYGRNLLIDDVLDFTGTSAYLGKGSLSDIRQGIVTAPILFAIEEFPQLRTVVDRGFDDPSDIDLALEYLGKSRGIQRTRELAAQHAQIAAEAIDSLPESDDEDVLISRRALVDLTHRVITRTK